MLTKTYQIQIAKKLERVLKRLPKNDKIRLINKIDQLAEEPRPQDCKKLRGYDDPPLYRVRVGDYRIIYEIRDGHLIVLVLDVGHRKDIYRK